ncbi:hypothetical protein BJF90_01540 [Pseudonocardia sp. CNS-004]|nr:hypothetical protein BJF90_01540 [Pseudonocardia sp. CNS-004]
MTSGDRLPLHLPFGQDALDRRAVMTERSDDRAHRARDRTVARGLGHDRPPGIMSGPARPRARLTDEAEESGEAVVEVFAAQDRQAQRAVGLAHGDTRVEQLGEGPNWCSPFVSVV